MKSFNVVAGLLLGAAAGLLAGCASGPEAAADASAPQVAMAATGKCREAPSTGTSIVRKDCSVHTNATSVDAQELMDTRRTAMPDPAARGR